MSKTMNIEEIMFLDIETVPLCKEYDELSERMKSLWDKKASSLMKQEDDTPSKLYEKAGIFAEFGKIICISVGVIKNSVLHIKSFYGDDEKAILKDFARALTAFFPKTKYDPRIDKHALCAHNGIEFDFPFICRRMIVNQIPLPPILDYIQGQKPWNINNIDTMELWKFGDYKNFTSLDLLAEILGVPSPKDEISGADVARVYYEENDLESIVKYCQKDVIALTQVYMRLTNQPLIQEIIIKE